MNSIEKIRALKEDQCVVDVLLKEIMAHPCKDCGKCVFGYEGITQLEMILKDITEKKGNTSDKALMEELCRLMKTQSLCEEGMGIADTVKETLSTYGEIFDEHIAKKTCRAGVCKKFMTYHILANQCIGCGECADVCEDDAIIESTNLFALSIRTNVHTVWQCLTAVRKARSLWRSCETALSKEADSMQKR